MRIVIPVHVWEGMLDELSRHTCAVERVAYLDGYVIDETGYPGVEHGAQTGIVTTVVFPDATLTPSCYQVSAGAMQDAGRHLPGLRMRRLAQVHTHGNEWVCHSPTDDDLAYSQRPGSMSIVLPFHARYRPGPRDAGVMISAGNGEWNRVTIEGLSKCIQLIPSHIDLRDPACLTPPNSVTPQRVRTTDISFPFMGHVRRVLSHWVEARFRKRS